MFPLGSVLVPGMVLPLHVFEPRYRQLVRDCTAADGEFGVVLIARGSEVGGGDVRTDVGTIARILQADEMPDGRFVVGAVGLRRIRVERWLDDDPYPRAETRDWPEVGPDPGASPDTEELAGLVRRAAALHAELGEPAAPVDIELSADPVIAGYQAALAVPFGPADRQDVLVAPSVAARFALLHDLLVDHVLVLEARLSGR
jgi:Lon protease-like protein